MALPAAHTACLVSVAHSLWALPLFWFPSLCPISFKAGCHSAVKSLFSSSGVSQLTSEQRHKDLISLHFLWQARGAESLQLTQQTCSDSPHTNPDLTQIIKTKINLWEQLKVEIPEGKKLHTQYFTESSFSKGKDSNVTDELMEQQSDCLEKVFRGLVWVFFKLFLSAFTKRWSKLTVSKSDFWLSDNKTNLNFELLEKDRKKNKTRAFILWTWTGITRILPRFNFSFFIFHGLTSLFM